MKRLSDLQFDDPQAPLCALVESAAALPLPDRRLELALPEAAIGNAPLFAVYPRRKYLSAKVPTFLDFIAHDPRLK